MILLIFGEKMEKFNFNQIEWSDTIPNEPGLYLFCREKELEDDYPIVHLVGINLDTKLGLCVDSDTWKTWFTLEYFNSLEENNGKWSKRILF